MVNVEQQLVYKKGLALHVSSNIVMLASENAPYRNRASY